MVILHFAEYASGGVATYLKDLIYAQSQLENVEKIYLLLSRENSDNELLNFSKKKVVIIPYDYKRSVRGIISIISKNGIIKKINPDIIHIHSSFAGLIRICYFFSKFKKRIIYCSHGWSFNREISNFKKIVYQMIEGILSFGCNKVINISNFESNSVKLISKKKMCVIYNAISNCPVNLKEDKMEPLGKRVNTKCELLFVGRLDRQKGLDILIKSLEKVNKDDFFHLNVVGSSVVDKSIQSYNMSDISFCGWKNKKEVHRFIKSCDFLVIPSRWEGFGLVALEGMQEGKAIISSDAGALPEIIVSNYTGFVFRSESENDLCRVLNHVRRMSTYEIESMGKNGRKRLKEKFDYEKMVTKVMDVYSKILSNEI